MFHVGIYQVEVGDFLRENLEQGSFPDNVLKSQKASFIQDHSELEWAWIFQYFDKYWVAMNELGLCLGIEKWSWAYRVLSCKQACDNSLNKWRLRAWSSAANAPGLLGVLGQDSIGY